MCDNCIVQMLQNGYVTCYTDEESDDWPDVITQEEEEPFEQEEDMEDNEYDGTQF